MKTSLTALLAGAVSLSGLLTGTALQAQTASPYQSAARPFPGIDIAAPVQLAASDASSIKFQTEYLPEMLTLVNSRLGESVSQQNVATLAVDPAKLTLATDAAVRVYFLGEGAGYLNTLGENTLTAALPDDAYAVYHPTARLLFPNATSQISTVGGVSENPQRTMSEPLMPGDFVDLGVKAAGTLLDFFIISNGAGGGSAPFAANASRNQDGVRHAVSFAVADSPYLIIGFEDLWGGGDQDYNDLVFAVSIGAQNVKNLVSAPEPAALLTMGGFLGLALCGRRRAGRLSGQA